MPHIRVDINSESLRESLRLTLVPYCSRGKKVVPMSFQPP